MPDSITEKRIKINQLCENDFLLRFCLVFKTKHPILLSCRQIIINRTLQNSMTRTATKTSSSSTAYMQYFLKFLKHNKCNFAKLEKKIENFLSEIILI